MPTASSVACVSCGLFMKATHTGQVVEELDSNGLPYKVWSCDEYTCDRCGAVVVTGFGNKPLAEHYQPDFDKMRARAEVQIQ